MIKTHDNLRLNHSFYINLAIRESYLSMNDNLEKNIPKLFIGAVLANRKGDVLGKAHKIENGKTRVHAEYQLLKDLPETNNPHLILYTTLEPCNFRHKAEHNMPSCSEMILNKKIGLVVIGILDPHPNINGKTIDLLKKNGVGIFLLQSDPKYTQPVNKIISINQEFINFSWKNKFSP